MTTTTTMHPIAKIAAAGLGRKCRTMTDTRGGTTIAGATNGEIWVNVAADAAADDAEGPTGSITPAPDRGPVTAAATISGRDLRRIIDGIVPATDPDNGRYALGGTLVEIAEGGLMIVVGTDGRRLHAGHIQPSMISGEAAPIVHADQWNALEASVRAVARDLCGATGRRVDAVIDRGTAFVVVCNHPQTGGTVVTLKWESSAADSNGRPLAVYAIAVAVAGRFPRWRDCLPENAPAAYQKPQKTLTVDAAAVAAAAGKFATLHRAAEKAGKAAHKAAQAEKKARRQPTGPDYQIDRGIVCGPAVMIGRGCEWSSPVPSCPVETILDQRYLAAAMTAAGEWGARSVEVAGSDEFSAVVINTGEYGPRLTAVIMPLARD